jgi:hypothetical protein
MARHLGTKPSTQEPFGEHIFFLIFFLVLGFELKAYTLSHSTSPFFVMVFFELGSHKLFVWVGFDP